MTTRRKRQHGSTMILTSHYMADVTALCKRIIVIDHGQILFDGPLADLSGRIAPFKTIEIDLSRDVNAYPFETLGRVVARDGRKVSLQVPKDETAHATSRLLADLPVLDLSITDPPIEHVIQEVFDHGAEPTK